MLRALAGAGADVVMHGLVQQDELDQKTKALKEEYGVKVGHSAANVRKPQEIRLELLLLPVLLLMLTADSDQSCAVVVNQCCIFQVLHIMRMCCGCHAYTLLCAVPAET